MGPSPWRAGPPSVCHFGDAKPGCRKHPAVHRLRHETHTLMTAFMKAIALYALVLHLLPIGGGLWHTDDISNAYRHFLEFEDGFTTER